MTIGQKRRLETRHGRNLTSDLGDKRVGAKHLDFRSRSGRFLRCEQGIIAGAAAARHHSPVQYS